MKARSRFATRAVAVLLGLLLGEGILRAAVFSEVWLGTPPNYGFASETLARVVYAYSGGGYSTLPCRCEGRSSECADMVYDAHRGDRHAPGLRTTHRGATLSTNTAGMRGTREYAVPKPASVTRIVAIGDSFTFGDGVSDDATWPAQLEAALPHTEVANLGERAYAHDQMYFALVDDGIRLAPDIVVLGFYEGDVQRDELTFYSYEKPRFSLVAGDWGIENLPVPTPRAVRNRYLALPLFYLLPRGLLELYRARLGTSGGGDERATEILRRTRAASEAAGARFIMVSLPDVFNHGLAAGAFGQYCERLRAECVDIAPVLREIAGTDDRDVIRQRFALPHDIHYSRDGYAAVAEALRRHLAAHPVAPEGGGAPVP